MWPGPRGPAGQDGAAGPTFTEGISLALTENVTTGASGVAKIIEWDFETSALPKSGFTHSTETDPDEVSPDNQGIYQINCSVFIAAGHVGLTHATLEFFVNGVAAAYALAPGSSTAGAFVSISHSEFFFGTYVFHVVVKAFGAANCAVVADQARTRLQIVRVQ